MSLLEKCCCFCTLFSIFLFTTLLCGVLANAKFQANARDSPAPVMTIVVDASGRGHFQTVQAAIDAVPWNNSKWICIYVKAGVYKEKVLIPKEKPFIYLKGQGKRRTTIVWDDHDSVVESPTFIALADNFFAKSISFANTYNFPTLNGNSRAPAVAAMVAGDQSSFYRCGFYGLQDTLWDFEGHHYFKLCTIVGAVDFIFGSGQSIYERCTLGVNAEVLGPGLPGYITAQGRNSPEESNGFVFKDCSVKGNGLAYLGRPWRPYARVVFFNTSLSTIVVPPGWDAWYSADKEDKLTFSEEYCKGPGSDKTGRVKWLKKMDSKELSELTSLSYVDASSDWLQSQPYSRILH